MRMSMGHRAITHHPWGAGGAILLSSVIVLGAGFQSVEAAEPCRVRNPETGQRYAKLQPAIDAAAAGATLEVRGTCRGDSTVDRDLVVRGHRTEAWGRARLRGTKAGAFTITVQPGASLTLKLLTIVGNRADRYGVGGGVANGGTTTFKSVRVRGPGYGTAVVNEGTLTLNDASRIGDGVINEGAMTLNHQSKLDGGGRPRNGPWADLAVRNEGTLTLNDRSGVIDTRGEGVDNGGTVVLNDESRVVRNTKAGIWSRGEVILNDSSRICSNGGRGIYVQGGSITMNGRSWISYNRGARGAGVFVRNSTLVMNDQSRIRHNRATVEGGGVYAGGATLSGLRCGPGPGANVRANQPQDCVVD